MNDYLFGNFLYTLRSEKGLSQSQLAQLLGVTNKAVSKWETGASKPNTNLIPKLAEILGVSVEELFACRRFEKNTELEQITAHLLEQKKKYAVRSSVFLALIATIPLLFVEFVCVMMGFQLPDDVAGPLGSMLLIVGLIVSVVAFLIFNSNFRSVWLPVETVPAVSKHIPVAIAVCALGLPSLFAATVLVCGLLGSVLKQPSVIYVILCIAGLVFILLFGMLIYLLNLKRLWKIKLIKRNTNPIPFRQRPLWIKICVVVSVALCPVALCLRFTQYTQLRYGITLILLVLGIVFIIVGRGTDKGT